MTARTALPPVLEPSVGIKHEASWAPKSIWNTQKYLAFAGNLWSLDLPARRPSHCNNWATPSRNSVKRYDNLKFGTGEPKYSVMCRGSPTSSNGLLAGLFGFVVQRTPHAPLEPGVLGAQDTKMYARSVSVATAYERSVPVSPTPPIHHPLTVRLTACSFAGYRKEMAECSLYVERWICLFHKLKEKNVITNYNP